MKSEEKIGGNERHSGVRVDVETGAVSHTTTVFRSGRETHEVSVCNATSVLGATCTSVSERTRASGG